MTRRLVLAFLLASACALTVAAAGPAPIAGAYRLTCSTDMAAISFPEKNDYCPLIQLPDTKPSSLSLNVDEKISNAHYYELKISGKSYWLVVTRVSSGSGASSTTSSTTTSGNTTTTTTVTSIGGSYFNALYFDADADGTITSADRIRAEVFQKPVTGVTKDTLLLWTTRPYSPLRITLPGDGTAAARTLTFSAEFYAFSENVSLDSKNMEKMLEALKKILNPSCYARICLETWFVGEIAASGDRVLKAAVVDGNQNGVFNEAKEDFLLIDANYDGLFDWGKEKKPLGKTLSGLGADGKKGTLTPAVAPWPRRLWLAAKGSAPTQAQLESE